MLQSNTIKPKRLDFPKSFCKNLLVTFQWVYYACISIFTIKSCPGNLIFRTKIIGTPWAKATRGM